MQNWIPHPTSLTSEIVELVPLEKIHFPELIELSKEKRIWEQYVFDGSNSTRLSTVLESALEERENGNQYPFVILLNRKNKLIGCTRFLEIQPQHKKLEIGSTWLHPDYWGTSANAECKLLLLTFCFEILHALRVQLKTDENNIRSRKAIEKIGGRFEGIIRNDMVRDNGTKRNSAIYSILDEEWSDRKHELIKLVQKK